MSAPPTNVNSRPCKPGQRHEFERPYRARFIPSRPESTFVCQHCLIEVTVRKSAA